MKYELLVYEGVAISQCWLGSFYTNDPPRIGAVLHLPVGKHRKELSVRITTFWPDGLDSNPPVRYVIIIMKEV